MIHFMMKHRRSVALCALVMVLTFASCETSRDTNPIETETEPVIETETETDLEDTDTPPVTEPTDTGYLDVMQTEVRSTTFRYLAYEGDCCALGMKLPTALRLMPATDKSCAITASGVEVGSYVVGDTTVSDRYLSLKQRTFQADLGEVSVEYSLRADPAISDINERYFHKYVFRYTAEGVSRTVTLTLKYPYIDDGAIEQLEDSIFLRETHNDLHMGAVSLTAADRGKPILILGNSFIGTSDIGAILQSMCDAGHKNDYPVVAVSVGYAEIADSWGDYLAPMRNGEYAAVFMCGFYGSDDVEAFGDYVDACHASGTPIAMFPAHNEGNGGLAVRRYPDVLCLNWKEEIDSLIAHGMQWSDFCIDDAHQHSNPLAGYVGAHMIYRALYGEMPSARACRELATQLGDYATTGRVPVVDLSQIRYIEG